MNDVLLSRRPVEALFEALLLAIRAEAPPDSPALKRLILDRVARDELILTVPSGRDGWAELIPKIHAKRVFTDGTAESWLVRLEAGARAPAHDHPGAEECIVLQGSVRYIGGSTLKAGDYEAVLPGAHHTELVSDTGALVFLRYAVPLDRYLTL